MNFRKLIQERIQRASGSVKVDSDVHAVVAANVGERGAVTHVSSTHRTAAGTRSKSGEEDAD